jgi:hypothetical protein
MVDIMLDAMPISKFLLRMTLTYGPKTCVLLSRVPWVVMIQRITLTYVNLSNPLELSILYENT